MSHEDEDDAALVARARAGDFGAFERLVGRHERRLYAVAFGIVRRREDAEDVVQAALVSALEHLADFRGGAAFATWLTRIATNAALKVLRSRRRASLVAAEGAGTHGDDDEAPPLPEFIAPWRDDPARIVEARELRRILDEAAAALPERLRVVFVLRDLAGLDTAETAAALGIGAANVKVRLLRARLLLRERLTRLFGDEAARIERPRRHEHAAESGGPA